MEQQNTVLGTPDTPSRWKRLLENVAYIGAAIILAVFVQHFLIRPFIVNGASMDPTLTTGDYLLIDRLSYRLRAPERGDVIVFKSPPEPDKYFVKRIVGLPGETVVIKKGIVSIINTAHPDGLILDEPFITHKKNDDTMTFTVPANNYFVMGDNRAGSYDSRMWGMLPEKNIGGRALVRLLPLTEIDYLPGKVEYK